MNNIVDTHFLAVEQALKMLSKKDIHNFITNLVQFFQSDKSLYIAGNGGSQSIAEHISTDWTKGIYSGTNRKIRIHSLNSVNATTTAIANDIGYEVSLSFNFGILSRVGDALFLISSSGKSPNIIHAAEIAKKNGNLVFAFSGFAESELYRLADFAITVDSSDYQVIEDIHAILGHAIFKVLLDVL